ncbi:MAG TPA: ATP-binding cassette domain-containing protein [Candidatus Coproplasma stercoravium]|nr:ATP-binding cassette domain-containing protein [Candidatus Coproplasma stercoravium]
MASLSLKNIYKVYPNGTKAVNDFSMEIDDKEFIVFVGPSGCGKSTVLRMIAGLEEISAGELKIDDVVVNDIDCKLRDTAMVFQNYALYPHMTVADNMAFPLKMTKLTKEEKAEIRRRAEEVYPRKKLTEEKNEEAEKAEEVKEAVTSGKNSKKGFKHRLKKIFNFNTPFFNSLLWPVRLWQTKRERIYTRVIEIAKILGLEEYLGKKPGAMSGGQRQRVALGRAMVRNPKVFLLDEPLSNLDAKLRTQMRSEITKLHNRLKTTFIYVTHDQVEAMTMGDRIVVMKKGTIQQIDTPANLYEYPANLFVAGFIGTPSMNFLDAVVNVDGETASVTFAGGLKLEFSAEDVKKFEKKYLGKTVTMGVRPEDFVISDEGAECVITNTEMLGRETLLYCDFAVNGATDYENGIYPAVIKTEGASPYVSGDKIKVTINFNKVHYFDKETEVCISNRYVSYNDIPVVAKGGKLQIGTAEFALPPALSSLAGGYDMVLPSYAVLPGGTQRAKVLECEKLKEGYLARIEVGGVKFYALFAEEVGGYADIDIDWHMATFKGAEEVSALSTENVVDVKLIKRPLDKKSREALPEEEKRAFDIDIDVGGTKITCPYPVLKRLLGASDRKIFGEDMELKFYEFSVTDEDTFTADIIRVCDYGRRKFAVCSFCGKEIAVPYKGGENTVSFGIDLTKSAVYDKKLEIKIS